MNIIVTYIEESFILNEMNEFECTHEDLRVDILTTEYEDNSGFKGTLHNVCNTCEKVLEAIHER